MKTEKERRWKFYLKRTGIIAVILTGNAWLYTRLFWPSTVIDVPEILANIYAKELCTCRYVIGLSRERCLEDHEVLLQPSRVEWSDGTSAVSVRVFWSMSRAQMMTERFGCSRL